jgi:hypothetical protein
MLHVKNIKKYLNKYYNIIIISCLLIFLVCIIIHYYIKNKKNIDHFDNTNLENKIIVEKYCIGFFAVCSHIFRDISVFFNENKKLPTIIDTSQQFDTYRPSNVQGDIMPHFFKTREDINITYTEDLKSNVDLQFEKYNQIDYTKLTPVIEKYFSPTQEIVDIENKIINKYNINVSEYCAIYYRGTDKKEETIIGSFDTYINKMNDLLTDEPNIKFIIQSDSKDFIDTVKSKFQNAVSFDDENMPSNTDKGIHNEHSPDENYSLVKNFLAIVYLISKCKYIICSSGNCSIWMMLFRGNGHNVKQFLNNEWY